MLGGEGTGGPERREGGEEWRFGGGELRDLCAKHESLLTFAFTLLVVLTVAPNWRSFLTTLEWPLEDAVISAVFPFCVEVEEYIISLVGSKS